MGCGMGGRGGQFPTSAKKNGIPFGAKIPDSITNQTTKERKKARSKTSETALPGPYWGFSERKNRRQKTTRRCSDGMGTPRTHDKEKRGRMKKKRIWISEKEKDGTMPGEPRDKESKGSKKQLRTWEEEKEGRVKHSTS